MVVSEKFSNFVVPMRVEGSAEVRPLSVVGGKLVGLSKVALITSAPPSFFLLYKLKDFRYLSQYRLSSKGLALRVSPRLFTFLKPYIMNAETQIQKVKELIEAVNLTKKRALGNEIVCDSFLEVIQESGDVLLIRASNLDCFLLPKSLVLAIAQFNCSYMVSTRYHVDDNEHFEEYPILRLHFFDN